MCAAFMWHSFTSVECTWNEMLWWWIGKECDCRQWSNVRFCTTWCQTTIQFNENFWKLPIAAGLRWRKYNATNIRVDRWNTAGGIEINVNICLIKWNCQCDWCAEQYGSRKIEFNHWRAFNPRCDRRTTSIRNRWIGSCCCRIIGIVSWQLGRWSYSIWWTVRASCRWNHKLFQPMRCWISKILISVHKCWLFISPRNNA